MVQKIDLSNLSSDVIANIASFMIGKPEDIRLKHNEALKDIQRNYKIYKSKTDRHRDTSEYETKSKFYIARWWAPFPIASLNHLIMKQTDKLREMIHEEIEWYEDEAEETCHDYSSHLSVSVYINDINDRRLIIYSHGDVSYLEMENDLETIYDVLKSRIETRFAPHEIIGISQINFKLKCVFYDTWILWYNYFEKWLYESFFWMGCLVHSWLLRFTAH